MTRLAAAFICLLTLAQCQKNQPVEKNVSLEKFTYTQPLMGTRFTITLYAPDPSTADRAAHAAFTYAAKVNQACSDYDVTSELMQLNAAPADQPVTLSPMLFDVLNQALQIAEQTNGNYDPTLGHHSYNWRMARKKNTLPSPERINQAKAAAGWQKLRLDSDGRTATKLANNMRLDLGGIAKGYAADGMLRIIHEHQITRASITAGGEILLGDPPPDATGWTVTVKNLRGTGKHTLANCAVSTSGDTHQAITINGTRYSHIIDPATGLGLTRATTATVIGPRATLTDALATAYGLNPRLIFPGIKATILFESSPGKIATIRHGE